MAHYAFLNENNIVTEVIVGIDETELIEGSDNISTTIHPTIKTKLFKDKFLKFDNADLISIISKRANFYK